ncbi:MAG: sn-glycerol-3-phosphate ABC transporter ATP-binding protein UgpC [Acidobacteriota bacterium]|nr:sn-glycerol-3-phosphate ABC transporter ATP-binding protein UgpC [Acidobacteriota bacterium]
MAEINLSKVCKRFGDVSVIEDMDLHIKEGEFMVLVGPSGCGKSTTLRMIAGLEEISDGQMHIGEKLVNNLPPKDRDVAMVFQSYALYPHMTVRENVSFGLKVRKIPKEEIDKSVAEAARILGLEELLDRKPKALSGGQRQRVALGRAIVRNPSVFLFDEPLSNLDAELRVQMRAEISKLQKRLGTTSVYVTHDQVEAMTMGHRITLMCKGDIMQVGTPLELYETPANLFTARFIGTPPMNVIYGEIAESGNHISAEGLTLPLEGDLAGLGVRHRGKKVAVGIRPENVTGARADESGGLVFEGEAGVVEPLGHEIITHVALGEGHIVAKLPPHPIPSIGDTVRLKVLPQKLHLFDTETEQRLV